MTDMNKQGSGQPGSRSGNPQSDRNYSKTDTGVHKSKLGGTNRQAGSSQDAPDRRRREDESSRH